MTLYFKSFYVYAGFNYILEFKLKNGVHNPDAWDGVFLRLIDSDTNNVVSMVSGDYSNGKSILVDFRHGTIGRYTYFVFAKIGTKEFPLYNGIIYVR